MKLPSSNQLPAWQTERAKLLQREFQRDAAAGKPIGRALRKMARRLHGRAYRCEPSRRMKLSAVTLRRLWDAWRRGGEVPAVFAIKPSYRPSALTASVALHFAAFCARETHKSMRAAWLKFAARPGSFGHGRRKKQPAISYDMVCHNFGTANFYRLAWARRISRAAQIHLAKERLTIAAALRERLERPKRQRVKRGNSFEI